jgi:hypothetical protein
MSDMNDPHIGILDKIVNTVGISRNETASQFWSIRVANTKMRSRGNQLGRIENRSSHPIGSGRIVFDDIF